MKKGRKGKTEKEKREKTQKEEKNKKETIFKRKKQGKMRRGTEDGGARRVGGLKGGGSFHPPQISFFSLALWPRNKDMAHPKCAFGVLGAQFVRAPAACRPPGCRKVTPGSPHAHFGWAMALKRGHNSTRSPPREKKERGKIFGRSSGGAVQRRATRRHTPFPRPGALSPSPPHPRRMSTHTCRCLSSWQRSRWNLGPC